MFDIISVRQGHEKRIPYEKTVIEQRAPTDDSIRLYSEIREKAYNSIVESIKIDDNSLNLSAVMFDDPMCFRKVFKYRLTLNGREIKGEVITDAFSDSKNEAIQKIVSHIANGVANDIVTRIGLTLARDMTIADIPI